MDVRGPGPYAAGAGVEPFAARRGEVELDAPVDREGAPRTDRLHFRECRRVRLPLVVVDLVADEVQWEHEALHADEYERADDIAPAAPRLYRGTVVTEKESVITLGPQLRLSRTGLPVKLR